MKMDAKDVQKFSKELTILYVEDEEKLRETQVKILSKLFKKVFVAKDGQEGLELYQSCEQKPHIVMTDLNMPRLHGVAMCQAIKDMNPHQAIIVISAHNDSDYLLELINIGIHRFLLKPVETNQLMQVLYATSKKMYDEIMVELYKQKVEEQKRQLMYQSKLEAMKHLLDNISHHWRQPLNILNINIQNLEDDFEDGRVDREFIKKFVAQNEAIIQSLGHTLYELSNFYLPDERKEEFEVTQMCKEASMILGAKIEQADIKIHIEGEDFIVHGSKNKFAEILRALLQNAMESIIQSGVKTRTIDIKLSDRKLFIQDSGNLVEKSLEERIFEPYFTTKEVGQGKGLSLYLCKVSVENDFGGTIRLVNQKGNKGFLLHL